MTTTSKRIGRISGEPIIIMTKTRKEKLFEAIKEAKELYHSLVLIIAPPDTGRAVKMKNIAEALDQKPINLNLELSKRLLEMTHKNRVLKTAEKLDEIINPCREYAILDFTEVLFDVSLKQDPLALLKRLSRNRTIIASWNGDVENEKLTYAEPGHQEYRVYDINGIQIFKLEHDL